jgi:protoheme IX farnesyltransferase
MTAVAVSLGRPAFARISRDYLELSKARIVMLVLITTAAGYLIGAKHFFALTLINTLIGTGLLAGGTNALNQYVEREHDKKMKRTRLRPLPDGRIAPLSALLFAIVISVAGTVYLGLLVNWVTAALGALTLSTYIFVYTPMKRTSTLCTIVGAVPGAIPPMMGWTAATGSIGLGAWILFAILFLWQMPHFMAISWIYREDYGRAGFAMLAVEDEGGEKTAGQAILFSAALLPVTAFAYLAHVAGMVFLIGGLVAAIAFLAAAIVFARTLDNSAAKKLFMVSNLYLMTAMLLLVIG